MFLKSRSFCITTDKQRSDLPLSKVVERVVSAGVAKDQDFVLNADFLIF